MHVCMSMSIYYILIIKWLILWLNRLSKYEGGCCWISHSNLNDVHASDTYITCAQCTSMADLHNVAPMLGISLDFLSLYLTLSYMFTSTCIHEIFFNHQYAWWHVVRPHACSYWMYATTDTNFQWSNIDEHFGEVARFVMRSPGGDDDGLSIAHVSNIIIMITWMQIAAIE